MKRLALCLVVAVALAATAHARPRAVRGTQPALDDDTLNALVLEFGSVDVQPGTQRTLGFYRWMCCVYALPVKVEARFYIDPGAKATLDPDSGLLTVAADAYPGTSFRVYADLERGRRIVSADVYVDTPKSNPLLGRWTQVSDLLCDNGVRPALHPIDELQFHGDRTYSVTWRPFETYKDYWGPYTFDLPPGHITFGIRGGNYIANGFHGDGAYTVSTASDGTRTLTLRGLSLGRSREETVPQTDCGAVFVSSR